jgi:hypothetical protein
LFDILLADNIIHTLLTGYNQAGYDKSGLDRQGYDEEGYDVEGFSILGYSKIGEYDGIIEYNKDGFKT